MILKLLFTPVLFSKKRIYSLSDFSYGEYLVYESGIPKYHFNILDPEYQSIRKGIDTDTETYLTELLKRKGHTELSFKNQVLGIPLHFKAQLIEFKLDKLPSNYLI